MSEDTSAVGDMQAVIDTAVAAVEPVPIEGGDPLAFVVPQGAIVHIVDPEKFQPTPNRKHGSFLFHDAASLVSFVNTHDARNGSAAVFACLDTAAFVAVLNGPTTDRAGWGDLRATLRLKETPDWREWVSHDGDLMTQVDFAEFVEAQMGVVVDPPAADLLEMASTFEATSSAVFRSALRLQNGQRQLRYEENVDARAAGGAIEVPEWLTLILQPFEGGDCYEVKARLRYRLNSGQLRIGYTLNRPDRVRRAAFDDIADEIAGQAQGATLYRGSPA